MSFDWNKTREPQVVIADDPYEDAEPKRFDEIWAWFHACPKFGMTEAQLDEACVAAVERELA
jgi:hypothetical protein